MTRRQVDINSDSWCPYLSLPSQVRPRFVHSNQMVVSRSRSPFVALFPRQDMRSYPRTHYHCLSGGKTIRWRFDHHLAPVSFGTPLSPRLHRVSTVTYHPPISLAPNWTFRLHRAWPSMALKVQATYVRTQI